MCKRRTDSPAHPLMLFAVFFSLVGAISVARADDPQIGDHSWLPGNRRRDLHS